MMTLAKTLLCLALALAALPSADAREGARLRERLRQARAAQSHDEQVPAGMRVMRDVAYGSNLAQRMDLYLPSHPQGAPVIMMVHGGGWANGDKGARGVADNKAARWVPRGAIFVSINYRLLPEAQVNVQAQDVALAAKYLQRNAANWGGDGRKLILMGHSAGAHLVALVGSDTRRFQVADVLGTVVLDSAALDVPRTMQGPHFELHDTAFGTNATYWQQVSPQQALVARGAPMFLVCSSQRQTSCPQAEAFVVKARQLGRQAQVLSEDLSHGEINHNLGLESDYTRQVELFLGRLAPELR